MFGVSISRKCSLSPPHSKEREREREREKERERERERGRKEKAETANTPLIAFIEFVCIRVGSQMEASCEKAVTETKCGLTQVGHPPLIFLPIKDSKNIFTKRSVTKMTT